MNLWGQAIDSKKEKFFVKFFVDFSFNLHGLMPHYEAKLEISFHVTVPELCNTQCMYFIIYTLHLASSVF